VDWKRPTILRLHDLEERAEGHFQSAIASGNQRRAFRAAWLLELLNAKTMRIGMGEVTAYSES
jgi:hypothetical protein